MTGVASGFRVSSNPKSEQLKGEHMEQRRCLGCMELYNPEYGVCPHCGYVEGTQADEAVHMILQEISNGEMNMMRTEILLSLKPHPQKRRLLKPHLPRQMQRKVMMDKKAALC